MRRLGHVLHSLRSAATAALAAGFLAAASEAQEPPLAPTGEEGDLRNQTYVAPLGFERAQARSALRAALAEGALGEASDALARVLTGPPEELVGLDERLFASPREAAAHLFAAAEPALREAWRLRHADPAPTADARPRGAGELAEMEARLPHTPRLAGELARAGDLRWLGGDPLAAAALYRRARLHAGADAPASLGVRAAACAALLELEPAAAEVAARHGVDGSAPGPTGRPFADWSDTARAALGGGPPATGPARFELAWCEPLDPDGGRRRLSAHRGIRASGPKALETDLRPAFAGDQVLVQDRRFLYRFDAEGGKRLERVDLEGAIAALGVGPAPEEEMPALGLLKRRPAAAGREAVVVHDDERGILLALRLGDRSEDPARPLWAISGDVLHRPGEPGRVLGAGAAAPAIFQPTPLVVDRRVYAVARRSLAGKERLELWCLDRASGAPLWTRLLCEGAPVRTQSSRSFRPSGGSLMPSAPVYSDGLVFVSTNLGVLAACDALDGAIAWLLLTARSSEAGPRWSTSDPIATRQGLFCGPQDSDFFYALRRELPTGSQSAGALFLRPPLARGALEAHLVARGERHYFYVRTPHWREVAELSLEPTSADAGAPLEARWRTSGDTGSHEEDLLYRPDFFGAELVLCTDRYLYAFDCASGFRATFRARTPLSPATAVPLPTRRVFGNATAFRTGIVVVGAEGVSFWIRRP